jgi:S1-C subfamily serine protease
MRGVRRVIAFVALSTLRPALASDPVVWPNVMAPSLTAQSVQPGPSSPPPAPPLYCTGEYADDFAALSRPARDFDEKNPPYTYCVRTAATYECPSYLADGSLRRTRIRVVAHGTAFGFRQEAGETLLLTNEHVAKWPAATDVDHVIDTVPAGCRRVSEELKIVDDEADAYDRDDIPLTSVVADPQLDIAVLRAKTALPVLPWRIGHSAGLRERNVVDVRGFPLGVLRANNVGKVVSALDHDEQRDWNHDDFVIDALLSHGNSGSPVLAISCRSGEFELVGVYHAGYESGSALNVVVGIDQVRDLMSTLHRAPRQLSAVPLATGQRQSLLDFITGTPGSTFYFPLGPSVAAAHARADGAVVYEIEGKDFPLDAGPRLVIEDLPPKGASFGALGRIWAGNRQGLRLVERASMDAETLGQVSRILDTLRRNVMQVMAYSAGVRRGVPSRERYKEVARLERDVRRTISGQQDVAQSVLDVAERLCPESVDATDTLSAALIAVPSSRAPDDAPGANERGPARWRLDLLRDVAEPELLVTQHRASTVSNFVER